MNSVPKRAQWLKLTPDKINLRGVGAFLRVFMFIILTLGLVLSSTSTSRANPGQRVLQKQVLVPLNHWQLVRWLDGATICNLYVRHNGQPAPQDVSHSCGEKVLEEWLTTPACSGVGIGYCKGLMLRLVSRNTETQTMELVLPDITMRVETVNCPAGGLCTFRPEVRVVATEPAEGFQITRVHVRIGDVEKIYDGVDAQLKLPLTDDQGGWLTYWAESSLGDESDLFQLKYRSVKLTSGDTATYRLDLIGAEWEDELPAGARLWEVLPPTDEPLPSIYEQPLTPEYLSTTNRYALLAGQLIRNGLANASNCADGGLLPNGAASPCGEKAAALPVLEWQNKYDSQIFDASLKYNIPARLLKGMIAQESQFWPISENPYEQGLGYITENGVSMLLQWNQQFYLGLCVPTFGAKTCWGGYSNLRADRQAILRGGVFHRIGSQQEIDVLAAMLYASAAQTKQLVNNVTRKEISEASTYEDMWKMSVANYYAGAGCLGNSLREVAKENPETITWDLLSPKLQGVCQIAQDYVERVVRYGE
jgi:hypothetical protein